ncbi:hypothetical protein GOBAR_DD14693 [Gossypium barbadense]|nr:hypothetical protein GOBAR_DD14693 [Gossypium barbadense]
MLRNQVMRLCMEAQECMVMGRWLDLASLMLTSAELVFPKVSDKVAASVVEHMRVSRGPQLDRLLYQLQNHMAEFESRSESILEADSTRDVTEAH